MKISMWGPRSSGKTTYLAMVYGTALTSSVGWTVRPVDIPSIQFVRTNMELIRKGEFPPANQKLLQPLFYHYEFRANISSEDKELDEDRDGLDRFVDFLLGRDITINQDDTESPKVTVEFADAAGEQFLEEDLTHALWENLASSDALICLLDPTNAEGHFEITFQLLHYLALKVEEQGKKPLVDGKLPQYFAVCFSKIDLPQFSQFLNKPKELVRHLEDETNINIDKLLLQSVMKNRLKYFTISAVGPDAGVEETPQGGRIRNPKAIRPINVLTPLSWLFQINEARRF